MANKKSVTTQKKEFNGLKIKNLTPFYIDEINDKFFTSLQNHPNRFFVNKVLPKIQKNMDEDELEKFVEIDNLTKNNKIKLMLNLALKKIASKTGSENCDLFFVQETDKFNEPLYIKNIIPESDVEVLGDTSLDRKYDFAIDINPNSYLYTYISQLQLSFFLDDESKLLSGGFSFNKVFNDSEGIDFLECVDKIYFYNLIKHFINKQLFPLSLNNILHMLENSQPSNKKSIKPTDKAKVKVDFQQITIESLHQNWINFVNRKFLYFNDVSEKTKNYIEKDLFFSILTSSLIALCLYEELKIYFTSQKPEFILKLLDKPSLLKEDPNQNSEIDFFELANYLRTTYLDRDKIISIKNIKSAEDIADTLIEQETFEVDSLISPIFSVEVYLKSKTPIISEYDLFDKNKNLKMIYLLTISPELFGMDYSTGHFIEYKQLVDIVNKNSFVLSKLSESLSEKIENSCCELNYDYITFLSNKPSMLLIKNNTEVFQKSLLDANNSSGLYEYYMWAQIYSQSRLWKMKDIELEFNYDLYHNIDIYHKEKLKSLENLILNWYDDFFEIFHIKHIVKKIDQLSELKTSIEMLINKIRQRDELSKKDKERKSVLFAYIIASLIGFINYLGMVYTILTVVDVNSGLSTGNIVAISVATFLALILVAIFGYFSFKVLSAKYRKKR
ncbi:MPN338 family protein [Malacoplasma iowae]|uniref:Uncharacterized protein n=1 Tax=Malacoplasma iowae DK-CPA TaxID=1394179 RepID=A0A084U3S4_MALIO|nr:hypothetical protein [Malacoplasma iowae]EGZ30959.1 hypothetical protein GUU_00202 [Malacoplasma iowae 695]KFB07610.1 hypothetical protein P271_457 [Malacoplasma iowae DK-CPA]WPL38931.1 hypothetical protein QX181_00125 [Malacoplasma iowae]WPL40042.1 hypothetical protein QX183_00640 [Malacoplasma iowae]WPL40499.1 hypothetical protein QX184_03065 [Malacoplasma iowae]